MEILVPYLRTRAHEGRFVLTHKGRLSYLLQHTVGDVLANTADGEVLGIEIKAEEENKWSKFFLETWSNKSRQTKGWMHTLNTDRLWYYFLDTAVLYEMDFLKLHHWAFTQKRIQDYPEKRQGKRVQLNDTWGRCVPITVIEKEVGMIKQSVVKMAPPSDGSEFSPQGTWSLGPQMMLLKI